MTDRTVTTPPNGSTPDLAAAKAAATATAEQFVNAGNLDYDERRALVETLKAQVAEIDRLEGGGQR